VCACDNGPVPDRAVQVPLDLNCRSAARSLACFSLDPLSQQQQIVPTSNAAPQCTQYICCWLKAQKSHTGGCVCYTKAAGPVRGYSLVCVCAARRAKLHTKCRFIALSVYISIATHVLCSGRGCFFSRISYIKDTFHNCVRAL